MPGVIDKSTTSCKNDIPNYKHSIASLSFNLDDIRGGDPKHLLSQMYKLFLEADTYFLPFFIRKWESEQEMCLLPPQNTEKKNVVSCLLYKQENQGNML